MNKLPCLALLALATAATPTWADSCGGKLIEYKKLITAKSRKEIGQLQLYYNASNGMNCAILKHSDATWGKAMPTYVRIETCPRKGGNCTVRDEDGTTQYAEKGKYYKYEAGPVRTNGDGKCVTSLGTMLTDDVNDSATVSTGLHCD